MSKNNFEFQIPVWIRNYLIAPEAVPLFLLSCSLAYAKYKIDQHANAAPTAGSNPALNEQSTAITTPQVHPNLQTIRLDFWTSPQAFYQFVVDHNHTLIQLTGTLLPQFLMLYSNRLRENREIDRTQQLREVEVIRSEMELQYAQAEAARQKGEYRLAYEHYSISLINFERLYHLDAFFKNRPVALQLYAGTVYRKALCLYYLERLDEAYLLINKVLKDDRYAGESQANIWLLNLRGLIAFKKSNFLFFRNLSLSKDETDSFLQQATDDFMQSYRSDNTQNCVYFYLKHIANDASFIVDNFPFQLFNSDSIFSLSQSDIVMQQDLMFIYANACAANKDYKKAIYLYELHLSQLSASDITFYQLFSASLKCFEAYSKYISENSNASELKLLVDRQKVPERHVFATETDTDKSLCLTIEDNNSDGSMALTQEEPFKLDKIKAKASKKYNDAKRYLDAKMCLETDPLSQAIYYVNLGAQYLALQQAYGINAASQESNGSSSAIKDTAHKKLEQAAKILTDLSQQDNPSIDKLKARIKELDSSIEIENEKPKKENTHSLVPIVAGLQSSLVERKYAPYWGFLQTIAIPTCAAVLCKTKLTL